MVVFLSVSEFRVIPFTREKTSEILRRHPVKGHTFGSQSGLTKDRDFTCYRRCLLRFVKRARGSGRAASGVKRGLFTSHLDKQLLLKPPDRRRHVIVEDPVVSFSKRQSRQVSHAAVGDHDRSAQMN